MSCGLKPCAERRQAGGRGYLERGVLHCQQGALRPPGRTMHYMSNLSRLLGTQCHTAPVELTLATNPDPNPHHTQTHAHMHPTPSPPVPRPPPAHLVPHHQAQHHRRRKPLRQRSSVPRPLHTPPQAKDEVQVKPHQRHPAGHRQPSSGNTLGGPACCGAWLPSRSAGSSSLPRPGRAAPPRGHPGPCTGSASRPAATTHR